MAIYGSELWWQKQKGWCDNYQRLLIRQGRTITGIFWSALAGIVVREAELRPAVSLLNNREQRYFHELQVAPRRQPVRDIFPLTLREGED